MSKSGDTMGMSSSNSNREFKLTPLKIKKQNKHNSWQAISRVMPLKVLKQKAKTINRDLNNTQIETNNIKLRNTPNN